MQQQLSNMGKADLRAACKEAAIKNYSKMTVADMRTALATMTTPTVEVQPQPQTIVVKPQRPPVDEKNGVRAPLSGVCRDLWDALSAMLAKGTAPDSKAVRELTEKKGWNQNNSSIEFSRWRRYHGFARPAKAPKAN